MWLGKICGGGMVLRVEKSFGELRLLRYAAMCAVIFVTLVCGAMMIYRGGWFLNVHGGSYKFRENMISDLGRLHAWDGEGNRKSAALFSVSMLFAAGTICFFVAAVERATAAKRSSRWMGKAGLALGVAAALFFVGVAAAPLDVWRKAHELFVRCAFTSLLGSMACAAVALRLTPEIRRRGPCLEILALALLGYLWFLFHHAHHPQFRHSVYYQKAVILITLITLLVETVQMSIHYSKRQRVRAEDER
jgi:hypothetical membrane protein